MPLLSQFHLPGYFPHSHPTSVFFFVIAASLRITWNNLAYLQSNPFMVFGIVLNLYFMLFIFPPIF